MTEIANGPREVETVDSSLNYGDACLGDSLFFNRVFRFVVE